MSNDIRVLHVDDEPDLAALIGELLNRENPRIETVTETDAIDALDRLDDGDIDCIVSDYRMPGMDGLEFLTVVRQSHPELPFILFTGQGSEQIASEALSAGATEYLQKGGGTEQYSLLANRIENAVDSDRTRERVAELERIRSTVRDINQALVRATSREALDAEVCAIISDLDPVRAVTISSVDPGTGLIEPRTIDGDDAAVLGAAERRGTEPDDRRQRPHGRAYAEREIVAVPDIEASAAEDPYFRALADRGVHAFVVVPLTYGDDRYGLLTIFLDRVQPIDDDARELLEELGADIGHAIGALESRRELAASEARFRTLTEAASDAIVTIDASSTITYANPATSRLFGYPCEALTGSNLTTLMPERHRDSHRDGIERYLRTGDRHVDWSGVELTGRHADGSEIPLTISFGEFERGGERYFIGILRDRSE